MPAAPSGTCFVRWTIQLLLAVALPSVAGAQLPTVTVTATDPTASEVGPEPGTFTFSRTGSTAAPLTISYTIGGTATNTADYTIIAASIQIPAGSSSATRTITPLDDPLVEGPETVVLTISPNASYEVGSPSTDTVTIADQPAPVVSVTATDAAASEVGPDPGTFTFTRTGDPTFALTVLYAVGGTAANGADYASIPTSVQFPAHTSTATRTITPVKDMLVEGPETVVLTISPNASYEVGSPDSATVTIADGTPSTTSTTSTTTTSSSTSTTVPPTTTTITTTTIIPTTTTTTAPTTTTLPSTTTTTTAPPPPTTSTTTTTPAPPTTSSTTTTMTAPLPPTTSSTTTTTDASRASTSTTTTPPPACLTAAECDDRDACTADTCDLRAGCVHTPLPLQAQATCSLDNIREILDRPPALECTGRCRCNNLDPPLDRLQRLLDAAGNASRKRLCKNSLRAARRAAIALEHRLGRIAIRGCVAPRERVERLLAAVAVLGERVGVLAASGFCARP